MKLFPDFEELLAAFDAESVSFVVVGGSFAEIANLWPRLEKYLGKSRPFRTWLLSGWKARGDRR